jgi:hypothetical protein
MADSCCRKVPTSAFAAMIINFGDGFFLRYATANDHSALCAVCLKTGDAVKNATWREDDPDLMGQI